MDIGQLIQKVYDLVTNIRNGQYMPALLILLEILKAIGGALPASSLGAPKKMKAAKDLSTLTIDELCDELEDCCKKHGVQSSGSHSMQMGDPAAGSFLDTILPFLTELLKRLFGF